MVKYPEGRIKVPRFCEENGFYTTQDRSVQMSRIKSTNTKPEQALRKVLWDLGIRYRKNVKNKMGKPDLVISRYKLVIFIDGEFWHGFNWEEKKLTLKSNRDFWIPKIERNMQRDREVNEYYQQKGWKVMRFWVQQVKKELHVCIKQILDYVNECDMYVH